MDDESGESMEQTEEVPLKELRETESGASRGILDDSDCVFRISGGKLRMLLVNRQIVFVNVPLKLLSQKHFSAQNALNVDWRPGSARTRWGSL